MLNSRETQTIRTVVHSFLKQHNVAYRVVPFDGKLYWECADDALRRGYPIYGNKSLGKYLPIGVTYAANASGCHASRPAQVWLAQYTAACGFVDDLSCRFPSEIPNAYMFNDRFIRNRKQGNASLDALADIIRRSSDFFPPIFSNLVTTSSMKMVASTLLDCETTSMKMSCASHQYPGYQRDMSGFSDACTFILFPREMPVTEYIQAVPEIMKVINEVNDILSFYKEELAGENTNQISIIAARNKESKLDSLARVAESVSGHYKTIMKIFEGSSEACNAFKHFLVGYFDYHFSVKRYKLADLKL